MNRDQLLAQLPPLHTPPPPGWWPPAPGWWLLAGLSVLLVLLGLFALWRRQRQRRYRRAALRALAEARVLSDDHQFAAQVNQLLRRAAVQAYGVEAVAPLTGADWARFLHATGPKDFRGAGIRDLIEAPYRPAGEVDRAALHRLASRWLRGHRRELPHV